MKRVLAFALAAVALAASTGCSHVAPYERAKIAHPTMTAGDLAGPGESHLRAVLEGATGGSLGAESGCGCTEMGDPEKVPNPPIAMGARHDGGD